MSPFEQQVEAALARPLLKTDLADAETMQTIAAMLALPVAAAIEAAGENFQDETAEPSGRRDCATNSRVAALAALRGGLHG